MNKPAFFPFRPGHSPSDPGYLFLSSFSGDGASHRLDLPTIVSPTWQAPLGLELRNGIHQAESRTERDIICRFRRQLSISDGSSTLVCGDRIHPALTDELDTCGHIFYLQREVQLFATLRINLVAEHPLPNRIARILSMARFGRFGAGSLSFLSGLAFEGRWRSLRMVVPLLQHAYAFRRAHRVRFDFTLCESRYVNFFKRLGYRPYSDSITDPVAGYYVPMVLLLDDVDHLAHVHSPLLSRATQYGSDAGETARWFRREFGVLKKV